MHLLENKHRLAARWFHWINFPLLFLMIWSGLMIYWANDVYRISAGNATLVHFFPDWFYRLFSLPQQLAAGMALHFFFVWFSPSMEWPTHPTCAFPANGETCGPIEKRFAMRCGLRFTSCTSARIGLRRANTMPHKGSRTLSLSSWEPQASLPDWRFISRCTSSGSTACWAAINELVGNTSGLGFPGSHKPCASHPVLRPDRVNAHSRSHWNGRTGG